MVPVRFQQKFRNVPGSFHVRFQGRFRQGSSTGSKKVPKGSRKVPAQFQQSSNNDPARLQARFQQGSRAVPVFPGVHFRVTTPAPRDWNPTDSLLGINTYLNSYGSCPLSVASIYHFNPIPEAIRDLAQRFSSPCRLPGKSSCHILNPQRKAKVIAKPSKRHWRRITGPTPAARLTKFSHGSGRVPGFFREGSSKVSKRLQQDSRSSRLQPGIPATSSKKKSFVFKCAPCLPITWKNPAH